jgi:hypothetical protein
VDSAQSSEESERITKQPLFRVHGVNIYNSEHPVDWANRYLVEKFWAWYYTEDKQSFKWFSYEEWLKENELEQS